MTATTAPTVRPAGSPESIRLVRGWIAAERRRRDERELTGAIRETGRSKGKRKLVVARHAIRTSYGQAQL